MPSEKIWFALLILRLILEFYKSYVSYFPFFEYYIYVYYVFSLFFSYSMFFSYSLVLLGSSALIELYTGSSYIILFASIIKFSFSSCSIMNMFQKLCMLFVLCSRFLNFTTVLKSSLMLIAQVIDLNYNLHKFNVNKLSIRQTFNIFSNYIKYYLTLFFSNHNS